MVEEFIGYVEGYLATTGIDSHGDRLTPEALESFAKQLKNKPSLRTLHLNHDTSQPIGYIVDFAVENKGQEKALRAKVGIYKSRPDVWADMQSGKLSGFSFGAKLINKELSEVTENDCTFSVEVEGKEWHDFNDLLESMGARVDVYVQKAVDIPTIITVTCALLSLPGTIYGIFTLAKRKSSTPTIKISKTQRILTFKDHTVEEIVEEIEASAKSKD